MRRLILGGLIVGATTLGLVGPAVAHEEINPSTFPTARPVFLTLNAANEAKADLVKVTLTAPAGVAFGATTKDPAGWTVNRTDQVITWSGGSVKPDRFEQWGFEIEGADQPGTLTYKATLGYADGKSDNVSVEVTAVVASSAASTSTESGESNSRADAALAIGLSALVLAAGGLVVGLRSSRTASAAAGPEASKADPGTSKAQDW